MIFLKRFFMIRKKGHIKTTLVFPCSTTSRQSFSFLPHDHVPVHVLPPLCTITINFIFCYYPYRIRLRNKTAGPTLETKLHTNRTVWCYVSQQFNVWLATKEKGQNTGCSHRGKKCDYLGSRLVPWLFLQNEDDFERKGISMYHR